MKEEGQDSSFDFAGVGSGIGDAAIHAAFEMDGPHDVQSTVSVTVDGGPSHRGRVSSSASPSRRDMMLFAIEASRAGQQGGGGKIEVLP